MDSYGIPSTRTHAYWALLPSPTALHFAFILAVVGRVEHLKPLDLVTGSSCGCAIDPAVAYLSMRASGAKTGRRKAATSVSNAR